MRVTREMHATARRLGFAVEVKRIATGGESREVYTIGRHGEVKRYLTAKEVNGFLDGAEYVLSLSRRDCHGTEPGASTDLGQGVDRVPEATGHQTAEALVS